MSYSRWSNSTWYTYYACSESVERDTQIFQVCDVKGFYYKELKSDLDGCIQQIKNEVQATPEEIKELKGYIQIFISDVESDKLINLIEVIKEASFENIPNLCFELTKMAEECNSLNEYSETLEELDTIIRAADSQLENLKIESSVGQYILKRRFQASQLEKTNRFQILKDTM